MSTVAHPFGGQIVSKHPKFHSQVIGKGFGNRNAEGIFLCSDDKTPAVDIFDMMPGKIMIVSDFISYRSIPFRSQHCLIYPYYTAVEITKMHTQDLLQMTLLFLLNNKLRLLHVHRPVPWRLSLRNNRWQVSNDVLTSLPDPSIYTLIPQSIRIDEIANDLSAALPIPPLVIPPTRVHMNTPVLSKYSFAL
jgi:hypothetical protein